MTSSPTLGVPGNDDVRAAARAPSASVEPAEIGDEAGRKPPVIRPLRERMEAAVSDGIAKAFPAHEIVNRVIHAMHHPTLDVIVQGCHALEGRHYQLQEAKWSSDRHELARLKMNLRWRAMLKAILVGM